MKGPGPLDLHIGGATMAVYMAYHGQLITLIDNGGERSSDRLVFPESILSYPPQLLEGSDISKAHERRLLSFAEMELRCDLADPIGILIYEVVRCRGGNPRAALDAKKGQRWVSEWRRLVLEQAALADSDLGKRFGPVIRAVQHWRKFDDVELAGWVHQNLERLIDEIGQLWPWIHKVASTWGSKGKLKSDELREICRGIIGHAFKSDHELRAICRFFYEQAEYCRDVRNPIVEQGVPFVRLSRGGELSTGSLPNKPVTNLSIAIETLRLQLPELVAGSNISAAVGRLFFLLYNGNYIVDRGKIRFVQFPVDPASGEWTRLDEYPDEIHRFSEGYARCARYALQFVLGGFMWASHCVLAGADGRNTPSTLDIEKIIKGLWIPQIFGASYAIASNFSELPSDCSVKYAAAVYARLAYIEGWWNPLVMREKLRGLLKETYELLLRYSSACSDLTEAIRCGLIETEDDLLVLAGDALDGRFATDEEYGTIMRYRRDIILAEIRARLMNVEESDLPPAKNHRFVEVG